MPQILDRLSTRRVLVADGILCLAMGAGLIALGGPLAAATGLGAGFLGAAGAVLLPVGAFILAVAAGWIPARFGLGAVVAGNVGWAAASLILPVAGLITPTPLGWTLVVAQAVAVAAIAAIEARGLGRAGAPA